MSVTKYERGNTFKTSVEFISGSTYVDPSGNKAYLTVYKPDGTTLLSAVSGTREDAGKYYYYISTNSSDPLGLYVIDWYGYFDYGSPWNYMPKHEKEVIQLVDVKQD